MAMLVAVAVPCHQWNIPNMCKYSSPSSWLSPPAKKRQSSIPWDRSSILQAQSEQRPVKRARIDTRPVGPSFCIKPLDNHGHAHGALRDSYVNFQPPQISSRTTSHLPIAAEAIGSCSSGEPLPTRASPAVAIRPSWSRNDKLPKEAEASDPDLPPLPVSPLQRPSGLSVHGPPAACGITLGSSDDHEMLEDEAHIYMVDTRAQSPAGLPSYIMERYLTECWPRISSDNSAIAFPDLPGFTRSTARTRLQGLRPDISEALRQLGLGDGDSEGSVESVDASLCLDYDDNDNDELAGIGAEFEMDLAFWDSTNDMFILDMDSTVSVDIVSGGTPPGPLG